VGAEGVEHASEASGLRMQHDITIDTLAEGQAQAACSCGWHSERFGAGKDAGTMDALQQARDAGDLHQWEAALTE
jgi:hypothetical protein